MPILQLPMRARCLQTYAGVALLSGALIGSAIFAFVISSSTEESLAEDSTAALDRRVGGQAAALAGIPEHSRIPERTLVVPKLAHDDISWLSIWLPDVPRTIYTPGDPTTPHPVPGHNTGKEASTYLTFIIENMTACRRKWSSCTRTAPHGT